MTQSLLSLILTQAWQIAIITISVAVVVRIAGKNRPHLSHALWMLVLIKCITPPLWGHSLGVFSQLQAWAELNEETAPSAKDASNGQAATIVIEPPLAELQFPAEPTLDSSDPIAEIGEFEDTEFEQVTGISSPQPTDVKSNRSPLVQPEEQMPPTASIPVAVEINAMSLNRAWLLIGLASGAVVTLVIMILRCLHCVRQIQLHRTTEFDDQLHDRIQHLAKQLRIRRIPNIIVSDVLLGPAVLGLLRHTIVLPRCLFENGDSSRSSLPARAYAARQTAQETTSAPRQSVAGEAKSTGGVAASREVLPGRQELQFFDPILAHELLHIRRGDLRTGTLQAIVQSLWWFHPAVWFCNRWLSREAERCCDEQVIAELGCTPGQYARSLLSVIECKHRLQPIPVFPGMKPVEITTQRMERIMSLKNGLKKRTPLWCWLMIAALALVVLPGAVAKPSVDEVAPNQTNDETEILQKDDVVSPLREFEGNVYWSDADLRKHLDNREQTEDTDRATKLDADRESIKSKYREVGYFDVEVTANTSSADDPTNRNVRFEVTEGPRYTIREVRFEGNNRISTSDLQQSSNLEPGDKYNAFQISNYIQRIRELYKGLGLKPIAINPVPHFIEERGIFDLVFEIEEEPAAHLSKKTYEIRDLLTRLGEDHAISTEEARRYLIGIFEQAIPPVMEVPQGFPALPKVAATSSLPLPTASKQLSSISLDGDQLIVVHSDAGHLKLKEEIDRFRKFGFKRFQVTARFITGSAEGINALMSSLKMEAPFSSIARAPVLATQHNPTDAVNPEKSAITTIQMGLTGIVSRDKVRAIENLARSKTDCLTVKTLQVQSFNGQTAMTHGGEMKPYIVAFYENGEPMIRPVNDGLTLHVTPAVVEKGMLRLQCLWSMEAISKTQTVIITQSAGKSPQRTQVPGITSKRVQTTVELKEDQTLWLSGLTATNDGQNQAALVVLEVNPISLQHYLGDQPLLDVIKTVVEPHNFQDSVVQEEAVLTKNEQSSTVKNEPNALSQLVVMTYAVADLVIPLPILEAKAGRLIEANGESSKTIELATAIQPSQNRDRSDSLPGADLWSDEKRPQMKADFAPLMELIKATVEPDSWSQDAAVVVENQDTLSLVARQTQKAHDEIAKLISQLRNAQDLNVRIQTRLFMLTGSDPPRWLAENCSLHPLQNGNRWALLPTQRCESFTNSLMKLKPEVLSAPQVLTISGQTATIQTGGIAAGEGVATRFRLEITPHLLPDSRIIRLQHAVSIGTLTAEMPRPVESLVGSGQTLVLLVGNGDRSEPAETATHFLVLLTPEYMSMGEEAEFVGDPKSDAVSP